MLNEEAELERHLSESLFVVSTGVNDNFNNGTFLGSTKFASYLLQEFSLRFQVYLTLEKLNNSYFSFCDLSFIT